jgi:valyl-tRNA synthetase
VDNKYDSKKVETKLYEWWKQRKSFSSSAQIDRKNCSIMMPPPNVTGVLHMGHLLNNTLQDILIRRAWQDWKNVLWKAGTDHAGISMQVRVEKELQKQGIDAKKLSRDEFLAHAVQWRDKHGNIILNQLQRLGVCCDLQQKVHTLDPDYHRTVLHGFVELFRRGYIYRGRRMINWCPISQTALSDEEVIARETVVRLYRVRYELVEDPGQFIEVCTTRPETIGGDVAIAVHPENKFYAGLVGKHCWRPFRRDAIPIISDEAVDKDFGTGALKITPAHSQIDFEIGQRHGLPFCEVIDADGILNEKAGSELVGLRSSEAREVAARILQSSGNLVSSSEHVSNISISERSGMPIEPRLSEQWFLRYPNVDLAKRAISEGYVRFFPRRWEQTYIHWLDNIHDWCISRQLRWGHRIPVWYRNGTDRTDQKNWHISIDGPEDPENWTQEEDVLDTWFSSAFWPLGTLGWPDCQAMKNKHFSAFFPTTELVTGPDIIFFWVARMIFMAITFIGENNGVDLSRCVPFRAVYFTGIVRDGHGRKMSKSLGNSPDPLDLIERYGADSVRFGLIRCAPQGQDILFTEECIEHGRNFRTKLWNACRFRTLQSDDCEQALSFESVLSRIDLRKIEAIDRVILHDLINVTVQVDKAIESYEFQTALLSLERFFRDDYCDWYVEACKVRLNDADKPVRHTLLSVQDCVLRHTLQLFSPFIPFITQELWQQLHFGKNEEILHNVIRVSSGELKKMIKHHGLLIINDEAKIVAELRKVIADVRGLRPSRNAKIYANITEHSWKFVHDFEKLILNLTHCSSLEEEKNLSNMIAAVTPWGTFAVQNENGNEHARLLRELDEVKRNIAANLAKLENKNFTERAPKSVIAGAEKLLADNIEKENAIMQLLHDECANCEATTEE